VRRPAGKSPSRTVGANRFVFFERLVDDDGQIDLPRAIVTAACGKGDRRNRQGIVSGFWAEPVNRSATFTLMLSLSVSPAGRREPRRSRDFRASMTLPTAWRTTRSQGRRFDHYRLRDCQRPPDIIGQFRPEAGKVLQTETEGLIAFDG
jgi:hypothetical protein